MINLSLQLKNQVVGQDQAEHHQAEQHQTEEDQVEEDQVEEDQDEYFKSLKISLEEILELNTKSSMILME
jgi:hypothetical protein